MLALGPVLPARRSIWIVCRRWNSHLAGNEGLQMAETPSATTSTSNLQLLQDCCQTHTHMTFFYLGRKCVWVKEQVPPCHCILCWALDKHSLSVMAVQAVQDPLLSKQPASCTRPGVSRAGASILPELARNKDTCGGKRVTNVLWLQRHLLQQHAVLLVIKRVELGK
jgi:hypothetical protein